MSPHIPQEVDPFPEEFEHSVKGIYGTYQFSGGTTHYVQTKARLGQPGAVGDDVRLAGLLTPVREVFDAATFNELLQRDIDDRRVRHRLIPYLFNTSKPVFFPPIIALLVPFAGLNPASHFAAPIVVEQDDQEQTLQMSSGEAFDVGVDLASGLGRVRWNSPQARVVVIDGQHRAMALLAIYRSLYRTWQNSEYEYFYARLQEQLSGYDHESVSRMEFPVTFCWFTPGNGEPDGMDHIRAARTVFVDLNSSANPVSESRELLLKDNDAVSIGVRAILNGFPGESDQLAATELDSQSSDRVGPRRWSTVVNSVILEDVVTNLLFAPGAANVDGVPVVSGNAIQANLDQCMREQLYLDSKFEAVIVGPDGSDLDREEIARQNIPNWFEERFSDHFKDVLGEPIVELLYGCAIPAAYCRTVAALREAWPPEGDNLHRLVRRAVFNNEGVFWSLMAARGDDPAAIRVLDEKKSVFRERLRSELRSALAENVELSDDEIDSLCDRWRTIAMQYGVILTYLTLAQRLMPSEEERDDEFSFNAFCSDVAVRTRESLDEAWSHAPLYLLRANAAENMLPRTARIFRVRMMEMIVASPEGSACDASIDGVTIREVCEHELIAGRAVVKNTWVKTVLSQLKKLAPPDTIEEDLALEAEQTVVDRYVEELDELLHRDAESLEEIRQQLLGAPEDADLDGEQVDEPIE